MNKRLSICITYVALVLFAGWSCSSTKKANVSEDKTTHNQVAEETIDQTPSTEGFVMPDIPMVITEPNERAKYLVEHFWENFDFTNEKLIDRPDITEQGLVDYIGLMEYVDTYVFNNSLRNTVGLASKDSAMLEHFGHLFEKYFYEPNSPFRNEEAYIPVLEELGKSKVIGDASKSRYEFQLEMVKKNRVGNKANNFSYTLASGQTLNLYDLKSEYTIVIFSNPGCPTCKAVMQQLNLSESINKALSMNSQSRTMLTILTIYVDEDLDEWRSHLAEMPINWTHAYDKDNNISKNRLYDIKAIPTLYLLDKDKKVVQKDTSPNALESFFTVSI